MTDPSQAVSWVCDHQDLVTAALVWLLGVVPVASILTWFTNFYNKLPAPVQTILHLLAGNILHAFANPPPAVVHPPPTK